MKLKEILEQVDITVPNNIPRTIKIQWINQVQNQLFRDYPIPESYAVIELIPGESLYELPEDCTTDSIVNVIKGEKKYPYYPTTLDFEYEMDYFYTIVDEMLMMYPTPNTAEKVFLYYRPRPVQLTVEHMDMEPTFPKDYHELLVIGCSMRVAKSGTDTLGLYNVLSSEFSYLQDKADRDLRKFKPKSVTIVRPFS